MGTSSIRTWNDDHNMSESLLRRSDFQYIYKQILLKGHSLWQDRMIRWRTFLPSAIVRMTKLNQFCNDATDATAYVYLQI